MQIHPRGRQIERSLRWGSLCHAEKIGCTACTHGAFFFHAVPLFFICLKFFTVTNLPVTFPVSILLTFVFGSFFRKTNVFPQVGYMRIVSDSFVRTWANRAMNVHPSLLPEFAGGMDLQVREYMWTGICKWVFVYAVLFVNWIDWFCFELVGNVNSL